MGERLEAFKMFGLCALTVGVIYGCFYYCQDRRKEYYPQREHVETKKDLREKVDFEKKRGDKETSRADYGNSIPFVYEGRNIVQYIRMREF